MSRFAFHISGIAALAVAAAGSASAMQIGPLKDCVPVHARYASQSINNYKAYLDSSGRKLSIGFLPLLSLYQASARYNTGSAGDLVVDADVLVELRPGVLRDQSLYPMLTMKCFTPADPLAPNTSISITHHCQMKQDLAHFGVTNFVSDLAIHEDAPECVGKPEGRTQLEYTLHVDINPDDVAKIRDGMLAQLFISSKDVADTIGKLFDSPDDFFRRYYMNFYQGWVQDLKDNAKKTGELYL